MSTEEALRLSEQQLRLALGAAKAGVWTWDVATDRVTWSDRIYEMHGMQPGTFGGRVTDFLSLVHRDDRGRVVAALERTLREGEGYDIEFRSTRPDGGIHWVSTQAAVLRTADGQVERMVGISIDITDQRRAAETRELLAQVLTSMSEGVSVADERGFIVFTNPALDRMLGYEPGELIGKHVSVQNAYPLEENARIVENVIEHLRAHGNWTGEWLNQRQDGTSFTTWSHIVSLEQSGKRYWVSVQEDVTERRRAEQALRESEEHLRLALAAARVGHWELDPVTDMLRLSERSRDIAGFSATEEVTFVAYLAVVHPDDRDRVRMAVATAVEGRQDYDLEYRIVRPDGSVRLVIARGRAVESNDDRAPRMLGVLADITEERLLERGMADAQRMESVGRVAGGVAHEVNNQMTVAVGTASLLLRRADLPDDVRADIEAMRRAGERAAAVTAQLLAYSRRQVLRPEDLDLDEIIGEFAPVLRRTLGESHELQLVLTSGLLPVHADRGQLEQVLLNLVLNARDAMRSAGIVTIRTGMHELSRSFPHVRGTTDIRRGRYVELTVSDTGDGMTAETLAHAFEPFFTTKPVGQGTGLGLSTVYGIVTQSGGYIWAYSEPDRGATFKIYLPITHRRETEDVDSAIPEPPRGTECVLLVEDDDAVRFIAGRALRDAGYRVLEAQNGEVALEQFRQAAVDIDLVVTDLAMPKLGGRGLVDRLQVLAPRLRVVYMSGYTEDAIVRDDLADDRSAFLQKPFTPETLAAIVRATLDSSNGEGLIDQ